MKSYTYEDYEIPKDLKFETRDIIDMDGLNCSVLLDVKDFDGILQSPAEFTKINLSLKFSIASKDIYVNGKIKGSARLLCGRCLEMFNARFEEEFTELYSNKTEIIDIMYITKQTLALQQSISDICSKDCKGLCAYCGVNKNEKQCDCKAPVISPFASLKDKFSK